MEDAKEVTIPLALLGLAMAAFIGYGFFAAGTLGVAAVLIYVGISLALSVVLGIIACYIAAALLDISFGTLGTACLKLAASIAFPTAVSAFIPVVGWVVALLLFYILLVWLFELEGKEGVICAVIILVVRWISFAVAGLSLGAMNH